MKKIVPEDFGDFLKEELDPEIVVDSEEDIPIDITGMPDMEEDEVVKEDRKDEIRRIFSRSSAFIMPSISEGLNRTPIEATLCGCPSVICDGAIDDVFFNNKTCLIAEKDNFDDLLEVILNHGLRIEELNYFRGKL